MFTLPQIEYTGGGSNTREHPLFTNHPPRKNGLETHNKTVLCGVEGGVTFNVGQGFGTLVTICVTEGQMEKCQKKETATPFFHTHTHIYPIPYTQNAKGL